MNDLRTAAQQALEALERAVEALQDEKRYVRAAGASRAITALREALAAQQALDYRAMYLKVRDELAATQQRLDASSESAYQRGYLDGMSRQQSKAEQPAEQEPEGSVCGRCGGLVFDPVLPQPAKREPLTDEEIQACGRDLFWPLDEDAPKFARAIERAHGIGEQE